jgi:hypothetical protein
MVLTPLASEAAMSDLGNPRPTKPLIKKFAKRASSRDTKIALVKMSKTLLFLKSFHKTHPARKETNVIRVYPYETS